MSYDYNLMQNTHTLAYFDHLEAKQLEPKLAVYSGKTLWIVSHKTDSLFEKITQMFTSIQASVMLWTGSLSYNKDKIAEIKVEIYQFHSQRCAYLQGINP